MVMITFKADPELEKNINIRMKQRGFTNRSEFIRVTLMETFNKE